MALTSPPHVSCMTIICLKDKFSRQREKKNWDKFVLLRFQEEKKTARYLKYKKVKLENKKSLNAKLTR
jgi:hypothetical protein